MQFYPCTPHRTPKFHPAAHPALQHFTLRPAPHSDISPCGPRRTPTFHPAGRHLSRKLRTRRKKTPWGNLATPRRNSAFQKELKSIRLRKGSGIFVTKINSTKPYPNALRLRFVFEQNTGMWCSTIFFHWKTSSRCKKQGTRENQFFLRHFAPSGRSIRERFLFFEK